MVAIKDMQMPDNCGECKLMVDRWCYALDADDQGGCAVRYDHRPDWCPLVEIPEDCDTCEYGGETWYNGMCDGCSDGHSFWKYKGKDK